MAGAKKRVTPDWHYAGAVVQSVIDTLDIGRQSQEVQAAHFELSVETLFKFLNGQTKGTPWTQTLGAIDTGPIRAGVPGWYGGRTRRLAYGRDRPPGLHVLTDEEWADVQRRRDERQGDD